MRILVVTYEFPPVGGGGGNAARDICLELARSGHQLCVLTSHYKDLPLCEQIQEGIRVVRVRAARRLLYKADLLTMTAFVLSGLVGGLALTRESRPDLLHVHFAVPSGPVAWLLSRLTGIPYVLTAHLGDVPGGVPEKTSRWFRWVYPLSPPIWKDAARVVAVSDHTRQLAVRRYPVNIQVIPNGVDLEKIDPGEIKVHNPPRIIFAGRFMEQKNPLQVVRTLETLREMSWFCVMAGDGPLKEDIEAEIQRCGLADRFHLTGWIAPEEVIRHMSGSDILFMPSHSEGLPVIGVQSLAMGLSIVGSEIGGMLDVVENGKNGYLVNPVRPEGYRDALLELLSAPARLLEFRQASRLKAHGFDIRSVAAAYEDIFSAVLLQNRKGE
jgi:glycosyltransferase involved in cell wall biosynthesis